MIKEVIESYEDLSFCLFERERIMSDNIWAIHLKDPNYSMYAIRFKIRKLRRLLKSFKALNKHSKDEDVQIISNIADMLYKEHCKH